MSENSEKSNPEKKPLLEIRETDFSGINYQDRTRLLVFRAEAIEAYAQVEQAICEMLACLLGIPIQKASPIFFSIVNTRSRSGIILSLLTRELREKFSRYWKSLFKFVGKLDLRRNQIIHWHTTVELHFREGKGNTTASFELTHPDFSNLNLMDGLQPIRVDDLKAFITECYFATESIQAFIANVLKDLEKEPAEPWLGIYLQSLTYPILDTHPLSQKLAARQSRHPPFEE